MEQNKVIDLVMKCLAMAESASYNPNEADNALRKARELCEAHGLEFAEMEATRQNKKPEDIEYEITKGHFEKEFLSWEKVIVHICNNLFQTRCFWKHGVSSINRLRAQVVFIGTPVDVRMAVAVLPIIIDLTRRYARVQYGTGWGPEHTSFSRGFVDALWSKSVAMKQEPRAKVSTGTSLVVVNKETQVEKAFAGMTKRFKSRRTPRVWVNPEAYEHGQEKGRTTSLNFHNNLQGVN
jgi:hypothetical protein